MRKFKKHEKIFFHDKKLKFSPRRCSIFEQNSRFLTYSLLKLSKELLRFAKKLKIVLAKIWVFCSEKIFFHDFLIFSKCITYELHLYQISTHNSRNTWSYSAKQFLRPKKHSKWPIQKKRSYVIKFGPRMITWPIDQIHVTNIFESRSGKFVLFLSKSNPL